MLIGMQQIINLTDFRQQLSRVLDEVGKGKTFLLTEKGDIKAMVTGLPGGIPNMVIKEQMKRLHEWLDQQAKPANRSNSAKIIRQMRTERTEKLMSYLHD